MQWQLALPHQTIPAIWAMAWSVASPPPFDPEASFGCPSLVFLQLLLGYRNIQELSTIYPAVSMAEKYKLVVTTLFPKQSAWASPTDKSGNFGSEFLRLTRMFVFEP
jgi:hypothetical protein